MRFTSRNFHNDLYRKRRRSVIFRPSGKTGLLYPPPSRWSNWSHRTTIWCYNERWTKAVGMDITNWPTRSCACVRACVRACVCVCVCVPPTIDHPLSTVNDLKGALLQEWANIPQNKIDWLIQIVQIFLMNVWILVWGHTSYWSVVSIVFVIGEIKQNGLRKYCFYPLFQKFL